MAAYADAGLGGRRMVGRPWGEMALAAVAGGLIVAACFAVFWRGPVVRATAPQPDARAQLAEARLRATVSAAHLTAAEEQAVLRALREARESGRAAAAYFGALAEDDGHAGSPSAEHADEMAAILQAVIDERLSTEVDRRRLHAVERQLARATDWLALDAAAP